MMEERALVISKSLLAVSHSSLCVAHLGNLDVIVRIHVVCLGPGNVRNLRDTGCGLGVTHLEHNTC